MTNISPNNIDSHYTIQYRHRNIVLIICIGSEPSFDRSSNQPSVLSQINPQRIYAASIESIYVSRYGPFNLCVFQYNLCVFSGKQKISIKLCFIGTTEEKTGEQNQVDLRHLITHFPTSSGVSEQASEQISALELASERSEQFGASK